MTTPFLPDELGTRHRLAQHYPVHRAFFDIREMLRKTEDIVCDACSQPHGRQQASGLDLNVSRLLHWK